MMYVIKMNGIYFGPFYDTTEVAVFLEDKGLDADDIEVIDIEPVSEL